MTAKSKPGVSLGESIAIATHSFSLISLVILERHPSQVTPSIIMFAIVFVTLDGIVSARTVGAALTSMSWLEDPHDERIRAKEREVKSVFMILLFTAQSY